MLAAGKAESAPCGISEGICDHSVSEFGPRLLLNNNYMLYTGECNDAVELDYPHTREAQQLHT